MHTSSAGSPLRRNVVAPLGTLAVVVALSSQPATTQGAPPGALLAVRDSMEPSGSDLALHEQLEGLGYSVVLRNGALVAASDLASVALIVLARGSSADGLDSETLAAATLPVVTLDPASLDSLSMSRARLASQLRKVEVSKSLHPIAAGLFGSVTLSSAPVNVDLARLPDGGEAVLSLTGDGSQALAFAFERGAQMASGQSPSRRVGLLLPDAVIAGQSRKARALFEAAVYWATETNAPPWVFAGPAQSVGVGEWLVLPGRASDDGLPARASVLSEWSVVSGPGAGEIEDAAATYTRVRFDVEGQYLLRLTSRDGLAEGFDEVVVTAGRATKASVAADAGLASPQDELMTTIWGDIMFIVNSTTSLTAGETVMKNRMEALGFTVTLRTTSTANASAPNGKAALVISPSAGNGGTGQGCGPDASKWCSTATPVMVMTSGLCDDYYVCDTSSANRGNFSGTSFDITSAHPASAFLTQGLHTVSTVSDNVAWGTGTAGSIKIATEPSNPTHSVISLYPQGSLMYQGVTAPNKRMLFGLSHQAGMQYATADGLALFDAAIGWLAHINTAPVVNAGTDSAVVDLDPPAATTLVGSASDDGFPNPPSTLSVTWSLISHTGAGNATIATPTCQGTIASPPACLTTGVSFTSDGVYTFQLSVSDGEFTINDTVVVTVLLANAPPLVSAGPDAGTIFPPNPATVVLNGNADDDGALGPLSYTWSKISGPAGTVGFSPGNALTTTASFPATGVYVLRLSASDGELSAYDDVVVTVKGSALQVVGNAAAPTADDLVIKGRLEAAGLGVTLISDENVDSGAEVNAAVLDRKLVVLAKSIDGLVITNQFKTTAKPVILMSVSQYDDMSMVATGNAGSPSLSSVNMVVNVPPHPLAAGLSGNGVAVMTSSATAGWGKPNNNGIKIALVPGFTDRYVVFGYEKNASMISSFIAPDRRVGITLGWTLLTQDGRSLLDAAIRWAAKINLPPSVSAGPDQIAIGTLNFSLNGTVGDDALVNATPALEWSVELPPGAAAVFTPAAPGGSHLSNVEDPTVTLPGPDTYLLRLSANDGAYVRSDLVQISVLPVGVQNSTPTVAVGPDRNVQLPETAPFVPTYGDDGLPLGAGLTFAWTTLSAPPSGIVTFAPSASVANATASFSLPGLYVLQLAVADAPVGNPERRVGVDQVIVRADPSRQALLITETGTLAPEESAVSARLVSLGFTVTTKTASASVLLDATGKAVVYVPSTIANPATSLGTKFLTAPAPMVIAEQDLFWSMKMTGSVSGTDFGTSAAAQTAVTITNPTHPMAAGYTQDVTVNATAAQQAWGIPNANAVPVASEVATANPAHITLFAYPKGTSMVSSTIASGRRVGVFFRADKLATPGWSLFDAAIAWATAPEVPALFVAGSTTPTAAEDLAVKRLQQLGFSVTIVKADAALLASAATGKALVVISDTVTDSTFVRSTFAASQVPVVAWYSGLFKDMFLTGTVSGTDYGTVAAQTSLTIASISPPHPLTAGLTAGAQVVTTSAQSVSWGLPSASAVKAASVVGSSTQWPIFGYELGASMVGGTAADRRVGFFPAGTSISSFNSTGWKLFDAAVRWATGGDADSDGLDLFMEFQLGTSPRDADSNDNGITDGQEKSLGLNPAELDSDSDGVSNAVEIQKGSDPFRADTDADGTTDKTDCFPLDPTRAACPAPIPGDTTPPGISLVEPLGASLVGAVCTPSPCPP